MYSILALYPFSFNYYEKLGFGRNGPFFTNMIDPEDVTVGELPAGWQIVTPDPEAVARDGEGWWGHTNGSIAVRRCEACNP